MYSRFLIFIVYIAQIIAVIYFVFYENSIVNFPIFIFNMNILTLRDLIFRSIIVKKRHTTTSLKYINPKEYL